MAVVQKNVLVSFSAAQMFSLVEKVEDYPQFLPWCGGVQVAERSTEKLKATLSINYHGIKQSFTTENHNSPPNSMEMRLVDGPFKHLHGFWRFDELKPGACKVSLDLDFEFSNKLVSLAIGPIFNQVANTLVDSFVGRAKQVYG